MKKILSVAVIGVLFTGIANAGYRDSDFTSEIKSGVDWIAARENVDDFVYDAPGALGGEVYEHENVVDTTGTRMFIPTDMYVRLGGGLNMNFATSKAKYGDLEYKTSDSYTTMIGLGWNLSSYVRTELGLQNSMFNFSHVSGGHASYQQANGMLYFDLARRYVMRGDVTVRRTFVPFVGFGAGVGYYEFQGESGADGVAFSPLGQVGINIMLSELFGIDIAYQYQMMFNRGFGWDDTDSDISHISNVVASFRMNF